MNSLWLLLWGAVVAFAPALRGLCAAAARLFSDEGLANLLQLLERRAFDLGELEIEALHGFDQGAGDHQPREWLAVGWHHVPGGMRATGRADHVLVGRHVLVPELALGDVLHGEFPALARLIEPIEQASALLLPRHMKKELENAGAAAGEVVLEGADVLEPLLPDLPPDQLGRKILARQHFRMDPHHQHLLVMGAIENTDAP